jgi:hypothetical protein
MFAPDVDRAACGFPHKESKGSCSKTSLVSQTCFSILYLESIHTHTHIYTSLPVFFFLIFFHFLIIFFSNSHYFKNSPISSKTICSHSEKIHQDKSLLCKEFHLFFQCGFICYDRPCNFSFSPQAAPIIATGQGEAAPTLVHSPS